MPAAAVSGMYTLFLVSISGVSRIVMRGGGGGLQTKFRLRVSAPLHLRPELSEYQSCTSKRVVIKFVIERDAFRGYTNPRNASGGGERHVYITFLVAYPEE